MIQTRPTGTDRVVERMKRPREIPWERLLASEIPGATRATVGRAGRVAAALLGDAAVPAIPRGVPSIPKHEGASLTQRVLHHVVEMCCLNETFTGVYLTKMLARTYLATRKGDPAMQELGGVLPSLVARSMDAVLQSAASQPEPDDAALESLGYLGADAGAALYREAFREVIAPGFEALAIGVAPELLAAYT